MARLMRSARSVYRSSSSLVRRLPVRRCCGHPSTPARLGGGLSRNRYSRLRHTSCFRPALPLRSDRAAGGLYAARCEFRPIPVAVRRTIGVRARSRADAQVKGVTERVDDMWSGKIWRQFSRGGTACAVTLALLALLAMPALAQEVGDTPVIGGASLPRDLSPYGMFLSADPVVKA